jgi:tetratricopeptide (TPR) repeat protein
MRIGAIHSGLDAKKAEVAYKNAAGLFAEASDFVGQGDALTRIGDSYFLSKQSDDAVAFYKQANDAFANENNPSRSLSALIGAGLARRKIADIYQSEKKSQEALSYYIEALKAFQDKRLEGNQIAELERRRIKPTVALMDVFDK